MSRDHQIPGESFRLLRKVRKRNGIIGGITSGQVGMGQIMPGGISGVSGGGIIGAMGADPLSPQAEKQRAQQTQLEYQRDLQRQVHRGPGEWNAGFTGTQLALIHMRVSRGSHPSRTTVMGDCVGYTDSRRHAIVETSHRGGEHKKTGTFGSCTKRAVLSQCLCSPNWKTISN